ncbi:MAG: alpha/beta hydrolase [Pseudomonadales bacterium]|nr:alpha/beta hydrolase [Pseudomonadales bacterium]
MTNTAHEITIEACSGLTFSGLSWGDHHDAKLLALHGWLDNAATHSNLAPKLAEHYHVVALDFAGHGRSNHRPVGVRYHLLDNVDDAIQCADALGWDTFTLMGHSMGAGVSTYITAAFPERIEKLVLLEGVGTHATEPKQAPETLKNAVKDMIRAPHIEKPVYPTMEKAVKARCSVVGSISETAAQTLCERGLMNVEGGYTWSSDPRLKMSSALRLTEPLVEAFVASIQCPALFVGAEQGFWGRMPAIDQRLQLIPNLSRAMLPGNHHHHLELDTYEAVADAVLDFLQS